MDIRSRIEAVLFMSARPMSIKKISKAVDADEKEVKDACEKLFSEYKERGGGLIIVKKENKVQMATSGEVSKTIQKFIKDETTGELSRPSLETLTIIAYRGPVSKTDLDRIRGVNCSLILRNLLVRGLVETKEEKEEVFYSVSFDFLRFLGVGDVKDLPDYERLSKDDCIDRILEDKEGNDINMNK